MGNIKNQNIRPRGKGYVANEPGEPLQVMESFGWLTIRDGDPLPVFKQPFTLAESTADQVFIAARPGFVLRIVSMHVLADPATTTTLQFKSKGDGASTAMSEAYPVSGGFVLPRDGDGHFKDSLLSEGIVLTSGAGETLVGSAKYVAIPLEQFTTDNAGAIISWNDGSPV